MDGKEAHVPHTSGELVYEGTNVTFGYAEGGEDLVKVHERNGIFDKMGVIATN